MKICIISPDYPTAKTIDFVFVDQLCRSLAKLGHTITIIAPQSITKSILRKRPLVKKISTIYISENSNILLIRPVYFTFGNNHFFKNYNIRNFNNAVNKAFRKLTVKPDVCYGHFWSAAYSIFFSAKNNSIPLFISSGEEELTYHRTLTNRQIKSFCNYVSGVISVSTKNKNEHLIEGLVTEENCTVIPNAIDQKLFYKKNKKILRQKYNFGVDDFMVIFVGQFTERKGVLRLAEALNMLKDSSIKAMFIGSGPQEPLYQNTVKQGLVEHDILPDYLNCGDVFVLPTLNEGCSNSIIEALACGLPVVSSDRQFNHDILDGKNSILIDPNDITAIAKAIYELKSDINLRRKLSRNAILTSAELSIEKRAEKIIDYIKARIHNRK